MPPKRPISSISQDSSSSEVFISSTIHDRSSSFVAHFSPTLPPRELQSLPDIAAASHKILAWRRPSSQRTLSSPAITTSDNITATPFTNISTEIKGRVLQTGFDDDGESYAGKKLLKILDDYKVEGSIVVARWYGGVLLGPVRFTHIEKVAREVVREYLQFKALQQKRQRQEQDRNGVLNEEGMGQELKDTAEEGQYEKKTLVEELKQRDESIVVLRSLLEEKMKKDKDKDTTSTEAKKDTSTNNINAVKQLDYDSMPLDRLKQMDKVRDTTIAFLLRKIDEAEKQEKESRDTEKDDTGG